MILIGDPHNRPNGRIPWWDNCVLFLNWLIATYTNEIIILFGDIFDQPDNDADLYELVQEKYGELAKKNTVIFIRGNHDFDSKSDALDIFRSMPSIEVFREPKVIEIEDSKILIAPYISRSMFLKEGVGSVKAYYEKYAKEHIEEGSIDFVFSHHTLPDVAPKGEKGWRMRDVLKAFEVTGHQHHNKEGFSAGYLNLGTPYQCRRDEEGKKSIIYRLFDKNFIPIQPEGDYLTYVTHAINPSQVEEIENIPYHIYTIVINCDDTNYIEAVQAEKDLRETLKLVREIKIYNRDDELTKLEPSQIEGKQDTEIFTNLCTKQKETAKVKEFGLKVIEEVAS